MKVAALLHLNLGLGWAPDFSHQERIPEYGAASLQDRRPRNLCVDSAKYTQKQQQLVSGEYNKSRNMMMMKIDSETYFYVKNVRLNKTL